MRNRTDSIPLARRLRQQLLLIGVILTFGCLMLSIVFVSNLEHDATERFMVLEAQAIIEQVQHDSTLPLPQGASVKAFRSWEDIPANIQRLFDEQEVPPGSMYQLETDDDAFNDLDLLHYHDPEFGSLYVISFYQGESARIAMEDIGNLIVGQTMLFTLAILALLFVVIGWLFKRAMQPLALLSQWATRLNSHPEDAINLNFQITELNDIAEQLREGVDKVRASNEREQQFLKHASHELRTPLAVIQASLDTLQFQIPPQSPQSRPVERAQKASSRMIQLSDTLLWLARESDKTIPRSSLALQTLCQQLVEDHHYLLRGRPITVHQQVTDASVEIEAPLLSIVLANLIRNACQHSGVTESGQGEIHIQLDGQQLRIINPVDPQQRSGDESFGLGLELVQRICRKLDWGFTFLRNEQHAEVTVQFGSATSKPITAP